MLRQKLVPSAFVGGKKVKHADPKKLANLREWCRAKRGRIARLGEMLGVSSSAISNALSTRTGCSLELYLIIKDAAKKLEAVENGKL